MSAFQPPKIKEIEIERNKLADKYEYLMVQVLEIIISNLNEKSIKTVIYEKRIKKLKSFYNKILKFKIINNYFTNIDDFAGVRVVCTYLTDLDQIGAIIEKNFNVLDKKRRRFDDRIDETGYQSDKYIVTLNEQFISKSDKILHENLSQLRCEIQVRTILMHSWASVSHQLGYKKKSLGQSYEREMYALSSLFFFADHQFDKYKQIRDKELEKHDTSELNLNQEINSDSLAAYLNLIFPERPEASEESYIELTDQLKKMSYSLLSDVDAIFRTTGEILKTYEKDNPISIALGSIRDEVGALRICIGIGDSQNKDSKSFYVKDVSKYRGMIND